MDNYGYRNPPMAQFHGLCQGNCDLSYVEGIFVLRKFDFRGLKVQFFCKKGRF